MQAMDDFFAPSGAKHLLIYYEHNKDVDTGILFQANVIPKMFYRG